MSDFNVGDPVWIIHDDRIKQYYIVSKQEEWRGIFSFRIAKKLWFRVRPDLHKNYSGTWKGASDLYKTKEDLLKGELK